MLADEEAVVVAGVDEFVNICGIAATRVDISKVKSNILSERTRQKDLQSKDIREWNGRYSRFE